MDYIDPCWTFILSAEMLLFVVLGAATRRLAFIAGIAITGLCLGFCGEGEGRWPEAAAMFAAMAVPEAVLVLLALEVLLEGRAHREHGGGTGRNKRKERADEHP